MRKALSLLAVVGVGAGLASACGAVLPQSVARDEAKLPSQITSVHLDSGSGDVTVRGSDGVSQVTVQRTIHYFSAQPTGSSFQLDKGVLSLNGCGVPRCSIDYVVTVPAGVAVDGKVTNGDVTLSRPGSVNIRTTSGDIRVDALTGTAKVQATNGTIHVSLAKPAAVQVADVNGDVILSVPTGRYRVNAETTRGDRNISVSNDPAGTYPLDVHTTNGDVTVKPA